MRPRVRLHTDGERACPVASHAAALGRRFGIERRPASDLSPPTSDALAVRRASRIRPVIAIDAVVRPSDDLEVASALGASPVAWEGEDAWVPWERCRAPLRGRPRAGSPDLSRGWLLVDAMHARTVPVAPTPGWQWHVIGGRVRPPAHAIWWADDPRVVAPLLGEASFVIGAADARAAGPLAMDAWRFGVTVIASLDDRTPIEAPQRDPLLGNVVSPLVARDALVWDEIGRATREAAPFFTPARVRTARERALAARGRLPERIRRQADLLRDDPLERARELRRWAFRKLFSSARPGRPREGV